MNDDYCKWVVRLRGVNVGGANKVLMADLHALVEGWAGRAIVSGYTRRQGWRDQDY
jgi:uncharacterized protein (DUF1697 family)